MNFTQTERTIHPVQACDCSRDFHPTALRIVAAGHKGKLGIDSLALGEELARDLVHDGMRYAILIGENARGEQHVLGGSTSQLAEADEACRKIHRANVHAAVARG